MSSPSGTGPLRIAVTAVQGATVAAVVLFVVMLFANEPSEPVNADAGSGAEVNGGAAGSGAGVDGAAVFSGRCASCHGATGGGGTGPALAGQVVERFPDVADQIAVVTDGRGGMPAFGGVLSPEEIEAVVDHTRSL